MTSITNLDRAQSVSSKTCANKGTEKNPVLPCESTLHVGFFFDGFSRNLMDDIKESRLTNVARLFLAYAIDQTRSTEQPSAHYRKFYISGLGSKFDETLGGVTELSNTGLDGALNRAKDSAIKSPEDTIKNSPLDAVKDVITGKKWWESAISNLKGGSFASSIAKAVAPATLDIFGVTRDNEAAATFFKTGVDTRLEAAFKVLEEALTNIKGKSGAPVKRISISVYGFDFGATLARAFAHKLFEECDPATTNFKGAKLEVNFAGLFDSVDRSGENSIILEYLIPFVNVVDDGECLPGPVRSALHLVAAHECQDSRRSRLIGTGASTPKWEERLVPGTSYDVGGGLRKDDVPHSTELHLASLHEMYQASLRAGVPFPTLNELRKIDLGVAKLFTLNDHINGTSAIGASNNYMSKAGNKKLSAEAFLAHRRLYIQRLRGLWELYRGQHKAYDDEEERLQRPILGKQGSIARALGMSSESDAQAAKRDQALKQTQQGKAALRSELSWLEDVDREAWRLKTSFPSAPVKALLDEWFAPVPKGLDFDVEDLLEFYVNDQYMIQQIPRGTGIPIPKYFRVREFDMPSLNKTKGMAPDYLEQMMRKPSAEVPGTST
ncbi:MULTISPECIES: phospholipase effector Tle1 domain-containing protein [Pseudomonas fluorescens group]|jgi:hypothetical protein|uniref:phospholipase effector Tle1 domain-containing protein n=1 Tax=Pseudomonas fluorescens group TaxID=136843 RepID=UPI000879BB73|nr:MULTISPECIES: DUF2235 domain-containing protein [Pseudomonas fluorescens group]SDU32453.1 Uncharacterized alpha/beta hydrolase domain [Pseudomonas moraviensis]